MEDNAQITSVAHIPLTKGYIATVDLIDTDLADEKWYVEEHRNRTPYATRVIYPNGAAGKSVKTRLHRVVLERVLGRQLVKGEVADHIDGNGLNNSRSNLRLATYGQNVVNSNLQSRNTSGYRGVSWRNVANKWIAKITVSGRTIRLGLFDDKHAAAQAYNDAAIRYYGEFARLNTINENS